MTSRFLPLLAPIALLAACAEAEPPPVAPSPTEAAKTSPRPAPKPEETLYVGAITARRTEVIPAPFTGRIKKVDVGNGQRVVKSDRLALLDDQDLKDKIEGLRAQEASSRAQAGVGGSMAQHAGKQLRAYQKLYKDGVIPRIELQQLEAKMKSDGASSGAAIKQAKVSETERAILERQVKNATVTAPIDGIVMNVRGKDGQVINIGEPLLKVYDPSDLIVRFAVPKALRNQLKKGGRVELKIDGVERKIWASIQSWADEEAPINLTFVVADLDDRKLLPDEVRLASAVRVRLLPDNS